MGHEDREREFRQALVRHLRGDGVHARNEARADVRSEPGETELCPDAGTLAAFHEGVLSVVEMDTTREHVDGCSRCQQVLLLLEATDEIPLQVEIENDLKMRESVLSTGASDVDYARREMPGLTIEGRPAATAKTPKDISTAWGFQALRWAAPAGAIAAGLLIWIVVREGKIQTPSHSENVQVAQQQPSNERLLPPALPPAPSSPSAVSESKALSASRAITRQGDAESTAARAQEPFTPNLKAKSTGQGVAASNSSITAPSANSPANVPMGPRDLSNLIALAPKTEPQPSKQSADTVSASAGPVDTSSADMSKQSAVPAPSASSGASANAADKKAEATSTRTVVLDGPVVPLVPTEQVPSKDKVELPDSLKRDGRENSEIILAPKGKVRWRLLSAGKIERSSDGGVSWMPQVSGVDVELIAGSAPSKAVCWIIGRGGTILKTTDDGVHWSKVAWPNTGEITGIQAFDAMHAVVYGGTGVMPSRFATNDGGATWFRPNK